MVWVQLAAAPQSKALGTWSCHHKAALATMKQLQLTLRALPFQFIGT